MLYFLLSQSGLPAPRVCVCDELLCVSLSDVVMLKEGLWKKENEKEKIKK